MKRLSMLLVVVALAGAAHAEDGIPKPGSELTPTQRRALQLLVESDPQLRKQVEAGITAEQIGRERAVMQEEQNQFFASQKRFVLIAYGVMWALVVGFVVLMFLRQRKQEAEIAGLEARLKALSKS